MRTVPVPQHRRRWRGRSARAPRLSDGPDAPLGRGLRALQAGGVAGFHPGWPPTAGSGAAAMSGLDAAGRRDALQIIADKADCGPCPQDIRNRVLGEADAARRFSRALFAASSPGGGVASADEARMARSSTASGLVAGKARRPTRLLPRRGDRGAVALARLQGRPNPRDRPRPSGSRNRGPAGRRGADAVTLPTSPRGHPHAMRSSSSRPPRAATPAPGGAALAPSGCRRCW